MNILQLSVVDRIGRRFNGSDLTKHYLSLGHEAIHVVWERAGSDASTIMLGTKTVKSCFYYIPHAIERFFSLQSILPLTPLAFRFSKYFRASDFVHYHLIQNNYFNILALPWLTRKKPSILTLHDMWFLTGHCVFSFECERWKFGCGSCPALKTFVPMRKDRTELMWKIKNKVFKNLSIDLIVASKWMQKKVEESPILSSLRTHYIPFGIDTDIFSPAPKNIIKNKLEIPLDNQVIGVRTSSQSYKGLSQLKQCLEILPVDSKKPITIITFDKPGLLDNFKDKFTIIDFGWIEDQLKLSELYNAMDVFLIPSMAESFNLTAIEAMSCGTPVIAFDTTPIVDLFYRDKAGITIPYGNSLVMAEKVRFLLENNDYRIKLSAEARIIAVREYKFVDHANKILSLYSESFERYKIESKIK